MNDSPPSPEMMEAWKSKAGLAEAMAKRAIADPVYREEKGLSAAEPKNQDESPLAALLKACAKEVIPDTFQYEIVQAIGGQAYLMLTAIRQPENEIIS